MSINVETVNERVKTLDAVLEGHSMTLAMLEGRVKFLERDVANHDPSERPSTVAEANQSIIMLEHRVMELLVRLVSKRITEAADAETEANDEPLVTLTDRASRIAYVAQVTQRLAAGRISSVEARTLLYAAQVHAQATGGAA